MDLAEADQEDLLEVEDQVKATVEVGQVQQAIHQAGDVVTAQVKVN